MSVTKQDLIAKAEAEIANYPRLAQFWQARDPRLVGSIEAMASMMALFSQTLDVQANEPFTKARDVTVLADAAVKGILPFGTPKTIEINAENVQATDFDILTGRIILDQRGRIYTVTVGNTIPANSSAIVSATQESSESVAHTVTENIPFYKIKVQQPENGSISRVRLIDSGSNEFEYEPDFLNVEVGEHVFDLETDEEQELYIVFGHGELAGYQPAIGEEFTIIVYSTEGNFDLDAGATFNFQTSVSPNEIGSKLTLNQVLQSGADPIDIATMREITNYPSIYDESSVFLGNFDFLVRRNIKDLDFLSIWNEQTEEGVRGESVDNINTLFVAAQKTGVLQATLEAEIESIIAKADDSYKVKHVAIVEELIEVTIDADISPVYDAVAVEQQIQELILEKYGQDSVFATRGESKIKYRDVYNLLEASIQALQGDQDGDIRLNVVYTGNDDNEPKHNKPYSRGLTTVTVDFVGHGFPVGDVVFLTNADDPELNDSFQISAVPNADQFQFETTATGAAIGTLSVRAKQKPEKWRYVSAASLTINVNS